LRGWAKINCRSGPVQNTEIIAGGALNEPDSLALFLVLLRDPSPRAGRPVLASEARRSAGTVWGVAHPARSRSDLAAGRDPGLSCASYPDRDGR